jgi:hypothetical protein
VTEGHLAVSPAANLPTIKGSHDRPPFRTASEINALIAQEGFDDAQAAELWKCVFLTPVEIANLLDQVQVTAGDRLSYLLHAVSAERTSRSMRFAQQQSEVAEALATEVVPLPQPDPRQV